MLRQAPRGTIIAALALTFLVSACGKSNDAARDVDTTTSSAPAATAPTQAEIDPIVSKSFSSFILRSATLDGSKIVIDAGDPASDATYLTTGDKINKLFAIDAVRILRDVPGASGIKISITSGGKTQTLDADRAAIDAHYGINSATMGPASGEEWRSFTEKYDNEAERARFVAAFVK